LGFGISASSCAAKAKAEAAPESPPLVMPTPPARVLGPVSDDGPIATAPQPVETQPATTAPKPTRPAQTRPPQPTPTPPVETAQPAAAQPAPTPPPAEAPPRELRTVDAAAEQKVRDLLQKASRDINRVDYQKLSTEGRSQYDLSKRFSDQAEQALRDRNTVFAATLADKAAALAAELLGR
jgi:hypothetical protein